MASAEGITDSAEFAIESTRPRPRTAVVSVAGQIDLSSIDELRRALLDAVGGETSVVVVDLSRASFIDSMMLGVLLGAARRLQERGGELRIACPDRNIRRIFEITLLDRVLTIFDTAVGALDGTTRAR